MIIPNIWKNIENKSHVPNHQPPDSYSLPEGKTWLIPSEFTFFGEFSIKMVDLSRVM